MSLSIILNFYLMNQAIERNIRKNINGMQVCYSREKHITLYLHVFAYGNNNCYRKYHKVHDSDHNQVPVDA